MKGIETDYQIVTSNLSSHGIEHCYFVPTVAMPFEKRCFEDGFSPGKYKQKPLKVATLKWN